MNPSLLDFLFAGMASRRVPTRRNQKLTIGSTNNPNFQAFGSHCNALVYSYENGTLEVNVYRKHDPEQVWRASVPKEQFTFSEFISDLSISGSFDPTTSVLKVGSSDSEIPMTLLVNPQDIVGVLHIANQCRIDSVVDRVMSLFVDLTKTLAGAASPAGRDPEAEGNKEK